MNTAIRSDQHLILHLGLGSFHRAHQAVYLQALHDRGDRRWALAGGNLRPDMPETVAALQAQGGAYTLETITPDGVHAYQRIEALQQVVTHEPSLAGLIALGASAQTRIISFTVTEAGYYLDAKNRLDLGYPDLKADLDRARQGLAGSTLYGALTAILRARQAAGAGPVTLLNCDNLRHNGERSRSGLLQFIELVGDTALAAWVQSSTTSPNAMVDRITPRPAPEVRERVKAATGVDDGAALMAESFIQWVIEDRFCHGRPDWEAVGVQMVDSVEPYEEAKIRLLNATHSCIAWAGTLVGYQYIHEGTHDPVIRAFAHDYVTDDVIPVLSPPEKPSPINLAAYRDVVLDRFGNPAIRDTNQRVAMDGFSKIPGFIAPTFRERLARGQGIASVSMLPALFLAYLQRWHRGEIPYTYQDQAMDPAAAHAICEAADPVAALLPRSGALGPPGRGRHPDPGHPGRQRARRPLPRGPPDMSGRLQDRHALLTGAGGGIGLAVAAAYLREGARCTLVDLAATPSEAVQDLMVEHGPRLQYVGADVSRTADIARMLDAARAGFGTVEILFNNAAIFDMAPLLESDEAMHDRIFAVNVKGAFFVMQQVLSQMVAAGVRGAVINMASQAGRRGEALVAHYCASKAAIISYTQSAALAMAPHRIRVNGIAPGVIDTPMWARVDSLFARHEGLPPGEKKRRVGEAVPLGHMGEPQDIAGAAVFLASDEASYITAQTLNVDGGNVMS